MNRLGSEPAKPELSAIEGEGGSVPEKESFLQQARRLVDEAIRGRSDDIVDDHLTLVPPLPEEPASTPEQPVAKATMYPLNVRPIETAPSYRPPQPTIEGTGALSPVSSAASAEGEIMTAQQRMAQHARRKIEIEHSMGPNSTDLPEDPPVA